MTYSSTRSIDSTVYLVRKDMDVNEHERLSNVTLEHTLK